MNKEKIEYETAKITLENEIRQLKDDNESKNSGELAKRDAQILTLETQLAKLVSRNPLIL